MRDTGNQVVLGMLVGIFAYCIIVLRTIRDGGDNPSADFVPSNAVFFGIILGFVGIVCLIYYIHHIAISIQATSIVALIARETIREIRENYPSPEDRPGNRGQVRGTICLSGAFLTIDSSVTGYIQNVDTRQLVALAEENDLVVQMQRRVGRIRHRRLAYRAAFSASSGISRLMKKLKIPSAGLLISILFGRSKAMSLSACARSWTLP